VAERETHAQTEVCFFCATDDQLAASVGSALDGTPYTGPIVWHQKPMSFCSHATDEQLAEEEEARRG
jgi:hypothetical protein